MKLTERILEDLSQIKQSHAEIKTELKHQTEILENVVPRLLAVETDVKAAKKTAGLLVTLAGLTAGWFKLKG